VPTRYDGDLPKANEREREVVLGVDVGTSALKAGLFTLHGAALASARAEYALSSPEEGAMEQDPADWWRALATVSHQLMAQVPPGTRVLALAIGGQAPTLVAVDADLEPTHPAITWLDQRPAAEADRLYARINQPVPVWGSWPSQAAWFVRNRPAALRKTRWLLGCPDYLSARLTRRPASMLWNPPAELEAAEVDPRLLPPAWVPGEVVGSVDPAVAEFTGLPAGTSVVGGYVDGVLGVLGSGVRRVGDACLNAGTSGTLTTVCLPPMGYTIFGLSLEGGAMNTSGKALDWFVQSVASPGSSYTQRFEHGVTESSYTQQFEHGVADSSYAQLLEQAALVPAGCDGLVFVPHLAGERAPHRDPLSRAAWVGLTLGHDRRHLLRAVLEGVAFGFRAIQESLERLGAPVHDVRCVGGQARSALWNQIVADVLNRPVLVPESMEAAVVGAAILAALGVGAHSSLEQAMGAMVRIQHHLQPDPRRVELYQRLYEIYREVYPALRETNWRLHALTP
jgi:xylulokinase